MNTDTEIVTAIAAGKADARTREERLYDAADVFDETLSPNGLIAFVGELFGSLGSLFVLRR